MTDLKAIEGEKHTTGFKAGDGEQEINFLSLALSTGPST
jgi:hypothetical protein